MKYSVCQRHGHHKEEKTTNTQHPGVYVHFASRSLEKESTDNFPQNSTVNVALASGLHSFVALLVRPPQRRPGRIHALSVAG
jgi:hypothetical protein